jgi:hypothetical protein
MKQVTFANCDGAGLELPPLWFELRIFRLAGKGGYYTRPQGTMYQFTDNVGCNYMLHPSQNSNILCTRVCAKQAICPRGQLSILIRLFQFTILSSPIHNRLHLA